jgi:hypothetical protein
MNIALILRAAKLTKLTHAELDGNFIELRARILDVNAGLLTVDAIKLAGKTLTQIEADRDTAVNLAIGNLINQAPSTLNTLKELADAVGNDPSFASNVNSSLSSKLDASVTSNWQQYALTQASGISFVQGQSSFNAYTRTGDFYIANLTSLGNGPSNLNAGETQALLSVREIRSAGIFIKQEITSNTGTLYVRTFFNGSWNNWRKVTM